MADTPAAIREEGRFKMSLAVPAGLCPQCEELREPGRCPKCDVEVEASEEASRPARARREALAPFRERLLELTGQFDDLPEGSIPVSNDQFATVVGDGGLIVRFNEITDLGGELEALDLNDPKIIGGKLRAVITRRVSDVEAILDIAQELAQFDPKGPAAELRQIVTETGKYGARMTQCFIDSLSGQSAEEVREAGQRLRDLLDEFPHAERLAELSVEVPAWEEPDFDARVELVIAKPGQYRDELGFLDLNAAFAAFAGDEPFAAIAEAGRRYFSHLLGGCEVEDVGLESFLLVPAINLATLDRPLAAHRIARSLFERIRQAQDGHPELVEKIVAQINAETSLIFAAIERIRRGLALLKAGEEANIADEEAVLKTVMDNYRELAETSFRTYGWLVLSVEAAVGGTTPQQDGPPTLGELMQQLEACEQMAAKELAASVDPDLRNASGHAQYRWDPDGEEVHDLRTDRRWNLEELEERADAITTAIAGADAGYSCFLAGGAVEIKAPGWLEEGMRGPLSSITEAIFGARGIRVLSVDNEGRTIVVADSPDMTKGALMGALAGPATHYEPDEAIQVVDTSGQVLADVDAGAFQAAHKVPEKFKDLAVLLPFLSDGARRLGDTQTRVGWIIVMANQLITSADVDVTPQALLSQSDRFGFVIDVAKEVQSTLEPRNAELRKLIGMLSKARACAGRGASGDDQAIADFAKEMLALNDFVVQRNDLPWPPSL